MICPQCSDFLKRDATECPECGWGAARPEPRRDREEREGHAWSPPTPRYVEEPWRRAPMPDPESPAMRQVLTELQTLKAQLAAAASPAGRVLDPEHVTRYLAACESKRKRKELTG